MILEFEVKVTKNSTNDYFKYILYYTPEDNISRTLSTHRSMKNAAKALTKYLNKMNHKQGLKRVTYYVDDIQKRLEFSSPIIVSNYIIVG